MLENKYNHNTLESKWQDNWYSSDIYHWKDGVEEGIFSIDTPPPTVSGTLHIGHVFSYCHTDFIARYQRMMGKNVFYPIGFDDNGLPTERLVEKKTGLKVGKLDKEGNIITKERFIKECHKIVDEEELEFEKLFKSIGISYDWRLKYKTISDKTKKISQDSFLDFYNKGLVYKKKAPVYWCVVDKTAIAQAEIEDKEKNGVMCYIDFKIQNSSEKVEIMTTRPEMLKACVALLYNKSDTRWLGFQGKKAVVPIFEQLVEFISDDDVNPEKGTGLVMCCTYGDWQDVEWTRRHNFKENIIISEDGKIDDVKVSNYREQIIKDLESKGFLKKIENIRHQVKCAERSGSAIEIINVEQWYIKVLEFKNDLLDLANEINFHPPHMKHRLIQWISGLNQDWCVSRDRFFGIEIPIEGASGVLDTWFTSSSTPNIAANGHHDHFPFNVRPQSHEIIRTWAFYTLLKSYLSKLDNNLDKKTIIPWTDAMISGWCLASDKTKMSKSKGNAIAPIEIINQYGADVVRYWSSTFHLGVDTAFNETSFQIGKKLVNKIWNASKFATMCFEDFDVNELNTPVLDIANGKIFKTMDLWILSSLNRAISFTSGFFANYEYAKARETIEKFFWNDFCDNYLEIMKLRGYGNADEKGKQSACFTVFHCIKTLLKLFAPFMPHTTEELFHLIFKSNKSIHSNNMWPNEEEYPLDTDAMHSADVGIDILSKVRKWKSEAGVSLKKPIQKLIVEASIPLTIIEDIKNVCNMSGEIVQGKKFEITLED